MIFSRGTEKGKQFSKGEDQTMAQRKRGPV